MKKLCMFDKEYTVEKIDPSNIDAINNRLSGQFKSDVVEFSVYEGGQETFNANTSINMRDVTTNIYNRIRNDAENFKERKIKVIDFVDIQTDKAVDFVRQKVEQAITTY